ncbi:MAG: formate C-acetyltransferase [Acholeplasmataceae bacterium]
MNAWRNFKGDSWKKEINVRDFMFDNYSEYLGDSSFLEGPTESSKLLNERFYELLKQEKENGGSLGMDTDVVSSLTSHPAAYINKDLEKIVGLQTDAPFKRAFHPYGGINVAYKAAKAYGYEIDPAMVHIFSTYRKTHNQGVFDVYSKEIRDARRTGIITGLPDGYGRGRIIGDYRRVALYGTTRLIAEREEQKAIYQSKVMNEKNIRMCEELQDQINALNEFIKMGEIYGFDLTRPAENAYEAIQWTYFGYLAAVKEQNGAAMSLGRTASFVDIYIERDLKDGIITEVEAQELIDHFIMKLRMIRFARTPEYNDLFTGDPTWVTESLAGLTLDGRSWVTKSTFRYLQTLYNLGTSAEPNLTVLWSENLPENFKKFCAKVSIDTSSIQYENDEQMRPDHGDDYGIACCVSPMAIGQEMQFFGARANLAKALLYAINGGRDELSGAQVGPMNDVLQAEVLDYDVVMERFDHMLTWLAEVYVSALNIIHYMHDKYAYEAIQMAFHNPEVKRNFATGVAGLSVVADSLSAIKHAKVKPVYDDRGLIYDFEIDGDFPCYGNNDDAVDMLAVDIVNRFMSKIRSQYTYRESVPTMSILTITSNVVYGKKTGNTPDGRRKGEPFAPGANPMHGRDKSGALQSLLSVSKIPCESCQDGISNTFTLVPQALGKDLESADGFVYEGDIKVENLVTILDGYFVNGGYHLNVNIMNRKTLQDAYDHPEKYPNLTIRVSGYAVNFSNLTNEQKREVISRTFHEKV